MNHVKPLERLDLDPGHVEDGDVAGRYLENR